MKNDKSKDIVFLSNELESINRNIEVVNMLSEFPMASLNLWNGSGKQLDLQIWKGLKEPLKEFLINYYENEKQLRYDKISECLNKEL